MMPVDAPQAMRHLSRAVELREAEVRWGGGGIEGR
jgi:hypothetical protein